MNKAISLFAALVAALAVSAQTSDDREAFAEKVQRQSSRMHEDIEIFRRILDQALAKTLDPVTMQGGHSAASTLQEVQLWQKSYLNTLPHFVGGLHPYPDKLATEGVYLKEHGVVFTVAFPWHFQKPVGDGAKTETKSPSEWERIRKEMRGEKTAPETTPAKGQEPSIADIVLRRMADNGRHFAQLGDNERLTVAVTLRPLASCLSCHERAAMGGKGGARHAIGLGTRTTLNLDPYVPGPTAVDSTAAAEVKVNDDQRAEAANYFRLGEMRQKQGRLKEAADSYRKAIVIYQKLVEAEPANDKDISAAADVAAKLAQTYMLIGDKDQAVASLDWLVTKRANLSGATGKAPTPSSEAEPSLPAKLIISAPKRVLDQVGAGKISLDEFKKSAMVELVDFKPAEKPTEKKTP